MKFIYIDVETTGLDPQTNSIFQLSGIVKSELGEEQFDYYLRPYRGETLTEEASAKTGKTQQELEGYPDQREAYEAFVNLLDKHGIGKTFKDKAFFVGFNSSFDMEFCRSWFEYNDNLKFGYRFFWPDLDVARLAAIYLTPQRHLMKNFQLTTVYETLFNEPFEDAHNSLADILATKRIFNYLSEKMLSNLIKPQIPIREVK